MERPEYGNKLSKAHADALLRLLQRYTQLASGSIAAGRYAADLDCGGGKSLSIACWAATVSKRRLSYTALIAATRVEELCKMKRRMVALGVPESVIGLWYSPGIKASEPISTGPHEEKQFLLVTHARVQSARDLETFNKDAKGRSRSITFYDESLLIARSRALSIDNLRWQVAFMDAQCAHFVASGVEPEDTQGARWAVAYLNDCMGLLTQELQRQERAEPQQITLPVRDADALKAHRDELKRLAKLPHTKTPREASRHVLKMLNTLLDMSQSPVVNGNPIFLRRGS
jgi:hypothetical protein